MKNGHIQLHRQFFDSVDWEHPAKSLAWLEFLSMAAWDDYTAHDGVAIKRGEVIASYGFLSERWGRSKSRIHAWISEWIAERQVERCAERCAERNAERFFIVNYAKYQESAERIAERQAERGTERTAEPIKEKLHKKTKKENTINTVSHVLFDHYERLSGRKVRSRQPYLSNINARLKEYSEVEIVRAWTAMAQDDFLRGRSERNENGKDYFTIEYALRGKKIDQYLTKSPTQIAEEHAQQPPEAIEWEEEITMPDGSKKTNKISI